MIRLFHRDREPYQGRHRRDDMAPCSDPPAESRSDADPHAPREEGVATMMIPLTVYGSLLALLAIGLTLTAALIGGPGPRDVPGWHAVMAPVYPDAMPATTAMPADQRPAAWWTEYEHLLGGPA